MGSYREEPNSVLPYCFVMLPFKSHNYGDEFTHLYVEQTME